MTITGLPLDCHAHRERTGDYVCNRCGYQWDKDDAPPTCKTLEEINRSRSDKSNSETARLYLNKIKEDLKK